MLPALRPAQQEVALAEPEPDLAEPELSESEENPTGLGQTTCDGSTNRGGGLQQT